jgi:hypothetical protein
MITLLELGITDGVSMSLVSTNVWKLGGGGTLNITCNVMYCNHQVHRDILITLYIVMIIIFASCCVGYSCFVIWYYRLVLVLNVRILSNWRSIGFQCSIDCQTFVSRWNILLLQMYTVMLLRASQYSRTTKWLWIVLAILKVRFL